MGNYGTGGVQSLYPHALLLWAAWCIHVPARLGAAPRQTDLPLLLFLIQGIWATFISHFKISKCMNDSHVFWDS